MKIWNRNDNGKYCVICLAILSMWGTGCGYRTTPARGVKHVTWSRSEGNKETVAGIDQADINIFTWNNGAAFVVWTDGTSTNRGTSPRQPSDPRGSARYDGKIGDMNIECVTPDGLTGKVKIGSESYDLADGRLFLVASKDGTPRICQMSLAKLDLKPDGALTEEQITLEHLRELARTDADIRSFFTNSNAEKQTPKP